MMTTVNDERVHEPFMRTCVYVRVCEASFVANAHRREEEEGRERERKKELLLSVLNWNPKLSEQFFGRDVMRIVQIALEHGLGQHLHA